MLKSIFKNIGKLEIIYIFLMGIATILTFIRSMCYGFFLSPLEMGYFAIAMTVASYGAFLQLGLMSGLNRELPVCLGRNENSYSANLVGEATTAVIFFQLFGILIFYMALLCFDFKDLFKRNAMFLGGFVAFSNSLGQLVLLRLRAERKILTFSVIQVVNAAAILFLGIFIIKWMSYQGAIFTFIFINLISFIVVSKFFLCPVNYFYFNLQDLFYLVRIGLPMMMAGVFVTLQQSMDRLFLIKHATVAEIGIYQIGILPLSLGVVVSGIISQYVSPKLLYRYGQGQSLKYVFNKSFQASLLIMTIMIVFIPLVKPLAGFIIAHWLPKYKESLQFITIFYFGAIFTSANITGIVINAANKQNFSFCLAMLMVLVCFFSYMIVNRLGLPVIWFAYMNVAIQIINFILETGMSFFVASRVYSVCSERIPAAVNV